MNMLEHVNITVTNPQKTAKLMCELFDWTIRWEGPSKLGGNTVHVGNQNDYLALYTRDNKPQAGRDNGTFKGGMNHIGILVDNLEAIESRVISAGFKPYNHADYEPGKRFYFNDLDDIEFEVVSYQ